MSLKLSKILTIVGTALAALAIFFFFAAGVSPKDGSEASVSMFDLMFGKGDFGESFSKVGGLTALFVMEIIIIVLAAVIIVGLLTNKISTKGIVGLVIVDCALILTCVILSFCTKSLLGNSMFNDCLREEMSKDDAKLFVNYILDQLNVGSGAIIYGVAGILGLGCCVGSLVATKAGK